MYHYSSGQAIWGLGAFLGSMIIAVCLWSGGGLGGGSAENFDKVQSGMAVDEVTRLLGWGFRESRNPTSLHSDPDPGTYELIWNTSKGEIHVIFINDRVFSKYKR
jgi:hypothetical protein